MTPESALREVFLERRRRNPRYSLRALARDLGVSHSYLSLALNGKRRLSSRQTLNLAKLAALPTKETTSLLLASAEVRSPSDNPSAPKASFVRQEMDRYRVLEEWYHLPILDLTRLLRFRAEPPWIARELGISARQAASALARLKRLGMLVEVNGRWTKREQRIAFPTRESMASVRAFHRQMIEKSLKALGSSRPADFGRRDITGITMPVNAAKIPQAKKRIERFRRMLLRFLADGECTDLYQLNVQLFPLTPEVSRE